MQNELDILSEVSERLDSAGIAFRMNDTPPEITCMVRERLMARPGAERVAMGSRMFDAARAIALASFPAGLSEIEIKARLCERMYGAEVDLAGFVAHLAQSGKLRNKRSLRTDQ